MVFYKTYDNGLKLVVNKMDGVFSVSAGVLIKTGSINESKEENGISHFIEHTLFKGTEKRTAFEISDEIDSIGAQINAFTSKELTCYYTKSTSEYLGETLEILSDIFFNSKFDEEELKKERGVVIEEINMCEDTPEDVCLDLLAEACYGDSGLGQTILGPAKNVKRFTKKDISAYMDKYYCADNVVISIAGNVDEKKAFDLVDEYFASNFTRVKSAEQVKNGEFTAKTLHKTKKIEQSHVAIAIPAISMKDERVDSLSIASAILGGGMSSRLFQKIREEMGLCYSVYSYFSQYKDCGLVEVYAGVNVNSRQTAIKAILEEIEKFRTCGITDAEFARGKAQIKSSVIFGQESTASQMLLYGKYLLHKNERFDFAKKIEMLDKITKSQIESVIKDVFTTERLSIATVDATE